MAKLLECLNMSRGESFELLEIGVNIVSGDLSEIQGLDKLKSIEDGVMKVFCMVYKHARQRTAIVRSLLRFFSYRDTQQDSYYHISELLLWILLKLLDNDDNFEIFCKNGKSLRRLTRGVATGGGGGGVHEKKAYESSVRILANVF